MRTKDPTPAPRYQGTAHDDAAAPAHMSTRNERASQRAMTHLLLDVDDTDHLVQVLSRVLEELLHLEVGLDLMELLDLLHGLDQLLDLASSGSATIHQPRSGERANERATGKSRIPIVKIQLADLLTNLLEPLHQTLVLLDAGERLLARKVVGYCRQGAVSSLRPTNTRSARRQAGRQAVRTQVVHTLDTLLLATVPTLLLGVEQLLVQTLQGELELRRLQNEHQQLGVVEALHHELLDLLVEACRVCQGVDGVERARDS